MNPPRVSVVVPAYNSAWSLGRTILSVLHQTLNDFELIVVDDGSTDDFAGAVAPFGGDHRLRIVHQDNGGLASARNRGIAEARAPLVAPIDADDLWHPDFLAECVSALEGDSEAPFAFAYSFRMNEDDYLFPHFLPRLAPRHDFVGLLSLNSVACGSSAVFRRDAMLRVGCYDEDMGRRGLHGAEDWKMILRMARLRKPVLVERYLVGYRHSELSMSQSEPRRQFGAVLDVIGHVRREMPDVSERALADARTMMTAWLLPAFLRQRDYGFAFVQALRAYAFNPFWFTNPLLRGAHKRWLLVTFAGVCARLGLTRAPLEHLSEVSFEGKRAFAYLQRVTLAPPQRQRPARDHANAA